MFPDAPIRLPGGDPRWLQDSIDDCVDTPQMRRRSLTAGAIVRRMRRTRRLLQRLAAFCRERFPDLEVVLSPLQLGPPVAAPVQVRLSGAARTGCSTWWTGSRAELRCDPGATTITDDWGVRRKKLGVDVDQPRARRAGVTSHDVAVSLQTAPSGFETTQYRER